MLSCIRIPARSLPCSRSECGSFGEGDTTLNARPLDYPSRLVVDFVGLSAMYRLKNDFLFPARSTWYCVSFAVDARFTVQ